MLFCSLQLPALPSDLNVQDDVYLKHLDDQSVRSLNGVRVAELILAVGRELCQLCVIICAMQQPSCGAVVQLLSDLTFVRPLALCS